MQRSGLRSWGLGLAAALAVFASAEPRAHACSQVAEPLVLVHPGGARVPGNLVFFRLNGTPSPGELSVVDVRTGEILPTHDYYVGEDHVFAPTEPIAPGRRLALVDASGETPKRYEFTTEDHVDVQVARIELREVEHDGRNVTFEWNVPDEFTALRHLLSVEVTVDGAKPALSRADEVNRFSIETSCNGTLTQDSCDRVYTWSPGKHEAMVSVHLFGIAQQPEPARLAFETTCEQGCSAAHRSEDPGTLLLAGLGLLFVRRRRMRMQ